MLIRKQGNLLNLAGEELVQFFKDNSTNKGALKEEITLFKGFSTIFKEAEGSDGLVHFTFSTDDVDSYGDVVEQDGWDLSRYQKNPVILWGHDHKIPLIGIARNVAKAPTLAGDIMFVPKEIHPFAGMVADMVKTGFIKAGSVGFNPMEWELIEEKSGNQTYIVGYRFKKQELMEFSICNVPANPFALTDPKQAEQGEEKTLSQKPPFGGFSIFIQGAQ